VSAPRGTSGAAAQRGVELASALRTRTRRSVWAALAVCLASTAIPLSAQWGRSRMSGLVFADSDTQVLAGATVELVGDPESERLRSVHLVATTSAKGKYEIENVPYGLYELRVSASGFVPYSIPLYLASDALTSLHARLGKAATDPIGPAIGKREEP
jgi:hypothetical protein